MSLIFVDCEAYGGSPLTGRLTEFGAVEYESRATFHGVIQPSRPSAENPAEPEPTDMLSDPEYSDRLVATFEAFDVWLLKQSRGRPVFVSDNVAFDWQWINCGFWKALGRNPFGHSGRRISDFYAGLCGDFGKTQQWKRFRITPHDHNPVHDAMGNVEAFERLLSGER
jgi:hypothetical protein